MVRQLIGTWIIIAVAFAITGWLLPGVEINGGVLGVLWIAALFGLVNAFLGTLLRILTLPLIVLTFGLFALLVNTLLIAITAGLSSDLDVNGFWTALWAAILISIITTTLTFLFRRDSVPA